jgi:toxin ParE1/3/4
VVQVVWTRPALASIETIRTYIAQFNPPAAQRMALRLTAAGMSLADHPERGRAIGRGRRELVTVAPYLIRYRMRDGVVEILALRHGARLSD